MNKIIFITGNKNKLREAQQILPNIIGKEIDLPEIQELDPKKIIQAKLQEAEKHHKGEYIVEDTSLFFDCLNGLPGPLIKWFLQTLGNKGVSDLVSKYRNHSAKIVTMIGYIDKSGKIKYFEGSIKGKIVNPRGKTNFGFDPIFIPDGYKQTFAQMSREQKNKISMRKKAFTKLAKYLKMKT